MSLSRMTVSLHIEVDPAWRTSDRLQIYTDKGTGTVDTAVELLTEPVAIFPDDARDLVEHAGYGEDPYGETPYGGEEVAAPDGGYGEAPYGEVPYGEDPWMVIVEIQIPQAFGNWKFSAQVIDGAGNPQGALTEFTQFVSGEDPPQLASFNFASFNSGTDKVTFNVAV